LILFEAHDEEPVGAAGMENTIMVRFTHMRTASQADPITLDELRRLAAGR
jgi:hypothetical protein